MANIRTKLTKHGYVVMFRKHWWNGWRTASDDRLIPLTFETEEEANSYAQNYKKRKKA